MANVAMAIFSLKFGAGIADRPSGSPPTTFGLKGIKRSGVKNKWRTKAQPKKGLKRPKTQGSTSRDKSGNPRKEFGNERPKQFHRAQNQSGEGTPKRRGLYPGPQEVWPSGYNGGGGP